MIFRSVFGKYKVIIDRLIGEDDLKAMIKPTPKTHKFVIFLKSKYLKKINMYIVKAVRWLNFPVQRLLKKEEY